MAGASTGNPVGHPQRNFTSEIPSLFKFYVPKIAPEAYRIKQDPHYVIEAVQTSYTSNGNNLMRFSLMRDCTYDMRESYLEFDLDIDQPDVGVAYLDNPGAMTLFKRVRLVGPHELEAQNEYHRLDAIAREHLSPINSEGAAAVWGFGTDSARRAKGIVQTHYKVPLVVHMLGRQPLPTNLIRDHLYLEILLAPMEEALIADSATGVVNYTISNPKLIVHQVQSSLLDQLLSQAMKSSGGGLDYTIMNCDYFLSGPISGTQHTIKLTNRSDTVEDVIFGIQPINYMQTMTNTEKFLKYPRSNLSTYEVWRGGRKWPESAALPFNRFFMQYLKHFNKWTHKGSWGDQLPIGKDAYETGDRMVHFIPLNQHRKDGIISNEGLAKFNADTEIRLTFTAAPGSTSEIHVYVRRIQTIRLNSEGHLSKLNE